MNPTPPDLRHRIEELQSGIRCHFVARWPADQLPGRHPVPQIKALLAGSFNPVHSGHLEMARIAAALLGVPVWFELSIRNADKHPLPQAKLLEICQQDFSGHGLLITQSPSFLDKSELFPNVRFVVGADTICRVGDPRFYRDSRAECLDAMRKIEESGCRFLVFARKIGNIVVQQQNLELDESLLGLCDFVPAARFVMDISSSGIREQRIETD